MIKVANLMGILCSWMICVMAFSACMTNTEKADQLFKSGKHKFYAYDYEGAMNDLNAAIELNPQFDQAWYFRANLKYNQKDYDGAMEDYNTCIDVNPGFADAYANRGSIKFENGDRDGACEDWRKAKEMGKENMSSRLMNCP